MLVVFLLDTSGSMNQQCANGLSLLDCAKSAVEHFHKVKNNSFFCYQAS
jgi:Mg-chelatase subunit ChlD